MIGKLQRLKLVKFFQQYDRDRDGLMTREDFLAPTRDLVRRTGYAEGSPEETQALAVIGQWWQGFLQHADTNRDGRISQDEWVQFWSVTTDVLGDAVAAGPEGLSVLAQVQESVAVTVRLMDGNHDGVVSAQEYAQWLAGFANPSDPADNFLRLGFAPEGATIAQFQYAMLDFLFSNNPLSPGNNLLGPLA